ncbi:P-loop NTPase fold protein [Aeromonas veronii]|uniref:P-loop NTPase fold protein n=1 Tax=Aeromonas veronii TaxID=654 RepID=UPI001880DB1B|nr:P-loop NTPase fold protein [Aeromonas veronii]MBE8733928.1 hypothetical protein [Aeromonas veronii]MBE8738319.1 hypothetical protein [Aeromonas veronii]MBE8741914.1 hypothetical protein [Aeromonas veronii]MBE8763264.1 hypothetical protein [Aeromonas veronii]MBE8837876.1 hypothetical protein [Aeromonas veronii]
MLKVFVRFFDIIVYTFVSWLIFSFIAKSKVTESFLDTWSNIQGTQNIYVILIIYFLAGLLTKMVLMHSGDYNRHHFLLNESRYLINDSSILNVVERFDLKLKLRQLITNPPLRLAIPLFIAIIYFTNDISLQKYINIEIIFYLLGGVTPLIVLMVSENIQPRLHHADKGPSQDPWYQNERPVDDLSQDTLNRTRVVRRLYNVITSNEINDTRGIAIIGPYGIGKSSIINMTITELELKRHNIIKCRVNSWGTYSSEEQIQKYLIEKIITSLGEITSTTRLSGLPSKYIHSLKGAKSFWLDILPIFENHSSTISQLDAINEILNKLNLKLILVIEDLDRNKDSESMLNSIAPLIDTLNNYNNFRFIISMGEKLNNPAIINRICRYSEFITFDRKDIYHDIYNSIKKMLKRHNHSYYGNIEDFFGISPEKTYHVKVRDVLFGYISTPRELKYIIRKMELHWDDSLHGGCDILDLLAITILKQYEPIVISALSKSNAMTINFKNLEESNDKFRESLINGASAEIIVNYFFNTSSSKVKPENRLQSCLHNFSRYFSMIVDNKEITDSERTNEQDYFRTLKKIYTLCSQSNKAIEIKEATLDAVAYRDFFQFIFDYKSLYSDNLLIPILSLIIAHADKNNTLEGIGLQTILDELSRLNDNVESGQLGDVSNRLINEMTSHIIDHYLTYNIEVVSLFFDAIENKIPKGVCSVPSINEIMISFKEIGSTKNIFHIIDAVLNIIKRTRTGTSTPSKSNARIFIDWLLSDGSKFSNEIIDRIESYHYMDNFSTETRLLQSLNYELNEAKKREVNTLNIS